MTKEETIKEGLLLPTGPTREVRKEAKKIVLDPVLTAEQIKSREGTYFDEKAIKTLIEEDADVYGKDPEAPGGEKLLAKFRKNVIPKELIEKGWEAFYLSLIHISEPTRPY